MLYSSTAGQWQHRSSVGPFLVMCVMILHTTSCTTKLFQRIGSSLRSITCSITSWTMRMVSVSQVVSGTASLVQSLPHHPRRQFEWSTQFSHRWDCIKYEVMWLVVRSFRWRWVGFVGKEDHERVSLLSFMAYTSMSHETIP